MNACNPECKTLSTSLWLARQLIVLCLNPCHPGWHRSFMSVTVPYGWITIINIQKTISSWMTGFTTSLPCLKSSLTLIIQLLHICLFMTDQTVDNSSNTLHGTVEWILLVILQYKCHHFEDDNTVSKSRSTELF